MLVSLVDLELNYGLIERLKFEIGTEGEQCLSNTEISISKMISGRCGTMGHVCELMNPDKREEQKVKDGEKATNCSQHQMQRQQLLGWRTCERICH